MLLNELTDHLDLYTVRGLRCVPGVTLGLLLDEPANHLDLHAVLWLEKLFLA